MAITTHDEKHSFGRALAAARRRAGLTQAQVAEKIGTTQAAITRLESGRYLPLVDTMRRLAEALEIKFEIGREGSVNVLPDPRQGPTLEEVLTHRDDLLRAAHLEGAYDLRVFGSVARGDATSDSDIDFAVLLKPGASLMNLAGLQLRLEEVVGRKVHVTSLPAQPSSDRERRVAARIEREAVAL